MPCCEAAAHGLRREDKREAPGIMRPGPAHRLPGKVYHLPAFAVPVAAEAFF